MLYTACSTEEVRNSKNHNHQISAVGLCRSSLYSLAIKQSVRDECNGNPEEEKRSCEEIAEQISRANVAAMTLCVHSPLQRISMNLGTKNSLIFWFTNIVCSELFIGYQKKDQSCIIYSFSLTFRS